MTNIASDIRAGSCRAALRQTPDTLGVGPSAMHWNGSQLIIDINEISGLPRVGRVRGQVIITPQAVTGAQLALDPGGVHVWRPFAPVSRIQVDLGPGQRWEGHGYFDANFGTRALEADFRRWTWGRYPQGDGALCFYDAERADGDSDCSRHDGDDDHHDEDLNQRHATRHRGR